MQPPTRRRRGAIAYRFYDCGWGIHGVEAHAPQLLIASSTMAVASRTEASPVSPPFARSFGVANDKQLGHLECLSTYSVMQPLREQNDNNRNQNYGGMVPNRNTGR